MQISQNGINFLKKEEGEKLVGYSDTRGIPTIGVGHTGFVDNVPVAVGMSITQEKSTALFLSDLKWVFSAINSYVKVPLTQNQFDALCSFVFNIGASKFCSSTLVKLLNAKDYAGAADQFLQWKRSGTNPDILLPRRKRERTLFMS